MSKHAPYLPSSPKRSYTPLPGYYFNFFATLLRQCVQSVKNAKKAVGAASRGGAWNI